MVIQRWWGPMIKAEKNTSRRMKRERKSSLCAGRDMIISLSWWHGRTRGKVKTRVRIHPKESLSRKGWD